MSKRVVFTRQGAPKEVTQLVDDVLSPLGPHEVTVEIEAAPVHIADLKFISGELPFYRDPPATPGMEAIGRVYALGRDVKNFNVGDRVFLPVRVHGQGAWRQYVNLPDDTPRPAPEGDACQLSLMPINGLTAYTMLHAIMEFRPGDTVIQNAANSSCGRYLTVLAKRAGLSVINVVRRPELIDELQELGADHTLLDGDDLADRVRALVGDAPMPMGIDAVAGSATQRIADCVSDGATLLSYGMLSGDPCIIRPETLFFRNLTLKGFLTFNHIDHLSEQERQDMWTELPDLVASGSVKAKIAATYTLDQIHDALDHAARTGADRDGKIILLPNG